MLLASKPMSRLDCCRTTSVLLEACVARLPQPQFVPQADAGSARGQSVFEVEQLPGTAVPADAGHAVHQHPAVFSILQHPVCIRHTGQVTRQAYGLEKVAHWLQDAAASCPCVSLDSQQCDSYGALVLCCWVSNSPRKSLHSSNSGGLVETVWYWNVFLYKGEQLCTHCSTRNGLLESVSMPSRRLRLR